MKFSLAAVLAAASVGMVRAEFFIKEQFNDDVSMKPDSRAAVIFCGHETTAEQRFS